MKKTILIGISLLAIIVLAATTQVNAQQWSAKVTWDDSECSCAIITKKVVEWVLYERGTTNIVDQGYAIVTGTTPPNEYTIVGCELEKDELLTLCARVYYESDAQLVNPCCKGEACVDTDSGKLIYPPMVTVNVILE